MGGERELHHRPAAAMNRDIITSSYLEQQDNIVLVMQEDHRPLK